MASRILVGQTVPHLRSEIFKFCEERKIKLRSGSEAEVGDIVVCSSTKNWVDPVVIGKVLKRAPKNTTIKLPPKHRDGAEMDMFVLTHRRQRKPRGDLKCTFLFFCSLLFYIEMYFSPL